MGDNPAYISNVEPAPADGWKRRIVSALASAILPGLGQFLLAAKRRALIYFVFLLFVVLLYWPLRCPKTYVGLICAAWLTLLLPVISVVDALRAKHASLRPASRWWLVILVPVAILVSVFYCNCLFRAAGFRNFSIPSSSMETTIGKGNLLVGDLMAYRHSMPRPYDVVLFRRDKTVWVKRVVAMPGDTIEGKAGEVIVNGKQLSEPYIRHMGTPLPKLFNFGPTTIPASKLFVMGDNRDVSLDSRVPEFGLVDIQDVLGKALYIYRSNRGWRGSNIR